MQQLPLLRFLAPATALSGLLLWGQNTIAAPVQKAPVVAAEEPQRFLMAHYMPWYSSKEFSGNWGWHWTMNHFHPEQTTGNPPRREAASHFYPLIGLYDSGDPDALKCQVMLMKLSGIDGVIFDWYGTEDFYDYALLNRNTLRLIPLLEEAGMRFAVCYEDQSVVHEIEGKHFPAAEAVSRGKQLMRWMEQNFFSHPSYLRLDGRPVLLSFGEPFYKDAQWNELFSVLETKPLYFTEHVIRAKTAATGAFDWPIPKDSNAGAFEEQDYFYKVAKDWPYFIPAAFPRFQDIYAQAGVSPQKHTISDQDGRTYTDTLTRALESNASIVQLVTWNDWGEGTQIEPSVEFGFRDLEATQRLRAQYIGANSYSASDLRLPVKWYELKKKRAKDEKLDGFFSLVISGRMNEARAILSQHKSE